MRNQIEDYACKHMLGVWSVLNRAVIERQLWVLVMELQAKYGVDIPPEAIEVYREQIAEFDLAQANLIERETKHDLRARLQHFNEQAGYNYAHWGLTSCDITEHAYQLQIRASLLHLRQSTLCLLELLRDHINASSDIPAAARTHNQPAQLTLIGKRFATVADELLSTFARMRWIDEAMQAKGLGGAVGTGQDLITLLGSAEKWVDLNKDFVEVLGFNCKAVSTGQINHRTEDTAIASSVLDLLAPLANLALMVRLETGHGRMWENRTDGQVGSSAMPHKRNSIVAERVCGLVNVARGYEGMIRSCAGNTWYEGDVSDSVVRRIALPGLFYAADAVLTNSADLLRKLDLNSGKYADECWDELENLQTGRVMAEALRAGADRDRMYAALQAPHSYDSVHERYPECPLSRERINSVIFNDWELDGAQIQLDAVREVLKDAIGETG